MAGADATARIAGRVAQRRVTLLLLPLRIWVGIGWLRMGLSKVLRPEWFDGTALTGLLDGQIAAGTAPVTLYTDLMMRVVDRVGAPLGIALAVGEVAIGLALLTGTLTNLALLVGILLNVNFILAGNASPSQFYIVIQLVLLAGGASAYYGVDRWLSGVLRSPLLTGHRGIVDGVDAPRPALILLAVASLGLAAAAVPTVDAILPSRGIDDPGTTLVGLLALTALLAGALAAAAHRAARHGAAGGRARSLSRDDTTAGFGTLPPSPGARPRTAHLPSNGPAPATATLPPAHDRSDPAPVRSAAAMAASPPAAHRSPAAVRNTVSGYVGGPPPPAAVRRGVARPAPPQPDGRSTPAVRPIEPWPAPAPEPAAARPPAQPGPPVLRDQPTTQFPRPRRRRPDQRPVDPYAELRDLPPVPPGHWSN